MIFQALVLKLQNIDIAFCQSIREVHRVLVPKSLQEQLMEQTQGIMR